jgi:hypothetical protein
MSGESSTPIGDEDSELNEGFGAAGVAQIEFDVAIGAQSRNLDQRIEGSAQNVLNVNVAHGPRFTGDAEVVPMVFGLVRGVGACRQFDDVDRMTGSNP